MASSELLGKFREMMEKKKAEEQLKKTSPSNPLYSKVDPEVDDKSKNIITDNSSISTSMETSNSEKMIMKARPTVFNLAKRFENKNNNDTKEIPKVVNKIQEENKKDINKDEEKIYNKSNYETTEEAPYFSNDYRSNSADSVNMRNSTNRDMIKNSLKNLLEKENFNSNNTNNYNDNNKPIEEEKSLSRSSSTPNTEMPSNTPKDDLSKNIITSLPRRSVHQIIKMNEKRIMHGIEDKTKKVKRHSVNQKFNTNMNEIARYLQSLKQNADERIDSEEFLTRNSDKLKQQGINEKDLPLVQELIAFFEKNSKDRELEREKEQEMAAKKRNTISNISSFKRFNINVQTITEEKDEDVSLQDSVRISNNRKNISMNDSNLERSSVNRIRGVGRKKKPNNKFDYRSNNSNYRSNNSIMSEDKIDETYTDGSGISDHSFEKDKFDANFASDLEEETFNPIKDELVTSDKEISNREETYNTYNTPKEEVVVSDKEVSKDKLAKQEYIILPNKETKNQVTTNTSKLELIKPFDNINFSKDESKTLNMTDINGSNNNFIIKNEIINIDKYFKPKVKLTQANEIFISYQLDKLNNFAIRGENYFTLKECYDEILQNKIKDSRIHADNNFTIKAQLSRKNFEILKMVKICRIKIAPKENQLYVSNTEDINYLKNKKKVVLVIQKVNNIELKRVKMQQNEISQKENIEYINKEVKKEIKMSVNPNNPKSFLEDQIENEEKMNKARANVHLRLEDEVKQEIESSQIEEEKMRNKYTEENRITIENFLSNQNATSRYQKNIINSLDSISISQYKIHSNVPLDPIFFDVLCINCYECVKYNEIDAHSEYCIIQSEDNFLDIFSREEEEEDYNSRIYKLHESLKKKQIEIHKTKDEKLIRIYEELTTLIYEILINNNSIEELDKSISALNEILNNKLNQVKLNYKFTLLVFGQRISQLVYKKLNDMEKILMCVKQVNEDSISEEEKYVEEALEEDDPENERQIQMLKMELANLEKQTLSAKVEIEQWRKESKKLENMLRRPNANTEMLSDINSDVVSRRDESFDGMTMVTGQTSEYDPTDIANMKDVNEILELNSEEEFKKYFLSIGLSLKFKYADRITENASIADLYEKAREKKIPISDWYTFICHELKIN